MSEKNKISLVNFKINYAIGALDAAKAHSIDRVKFLLSNIQDDLREASTLLTEIESEEFQKSLNKQFGERL